MPCSALVWNPGRSMTMSLSAGGTLTAIDGTSLATVSLMSSDGPARMNEHVDRYVAERLEEGDQHASQGGIAGNAPHVVPLPSFASFDPVETAMRAGSSADIRDTVANDVPSIGVDVPPADNDIAIEPPGMDLDLVDKKERTLESYRV